MDFKNKIDIFLVEDDKIFLLALKADVEETFTHMNIKIHTFLTGELCMLKFGQIMPKIVVLDYFLSGKNPDSADGISILDQIKRDGLDTYVIMLTNDDHLDIALESFHHGASDYVVKTATKFRKINYSLSNIFKIIDAKRETKKYKFLLSVLLMCIASLAGGIVAIVLFAPFLLR